MEMNEEAQVHTLEGLFASSLIILTALMITRSSLLITPQSELAMDVQLKQMSDDALAVLDVAPETAIQSNLTELVAGWDIPATSQENSSLKALDYEIRNQLKDVIYNIDFAYVDKNDNFNVTHAIINGLPIENSVVATRLVTLYNSTVSLEGGNWSNWSPYAYDVKVVEVRLIAWRV